MRQPSTEELLRASSGDERAFEALVREYSGPVRSYLHRLVADPVEAEDLSQEVFLRMARGLGDFGGRSRFSTWLFQIARNVGIDHLRKRESERTRASRAADGDVHGHNPVGEFEDAHVLWACIQMLNEDLRSALLLRDLLGFSYKEIADILDTTLATVKWRIYTAREQVQARFREAETISDTGRMPELGG